MRTAKKTVPTLDLFRLAAVLLVVMNHTSPLADVSAMADFWLTRVLARVAVPFFLMTTGYFLSRNHWAGVGRQLKKLCLLYGVCILLYLPVNLYAGSFTGPADVLRKLLVDGTFYHLWYFPATILGIVIARWLSRLGLRVALPVAALLYLIGLGGDSYYGLVSQIPLLRTLYDGIFTLCGYTRNGLFFAPLFLLLGAAGRRWNQKLSLAGFFLSLAAMSAEGLWLHRMDVQRHDSMYLALPLCIVCLFSLLLGGNKGESRKVREFSTAMYVLHPLYILAKEMIKREKEGKGFNFFHFMIDLTGGPCVYKRLSGCGSGTEYLAVTPWGDFYPCHQFVGEEQYLMGNVDEGITKPEIVKDFGRCNVYTKPDCKDCFARFYCSGGCAANGYHFGGDIRGNYKIGCELQRKRVECAIMIKAALAE